MHKTILTISANMAALLVLFGGVIFGILAITGALSIVAKLFWA